MINNIIFVILATFAGILAWPKWMNMNKKFFLPRTYFRLSFLLSHSQHEAVFRSIFYFVFGILVITVLSIVHPIPATRIFGLVGTDGSVAAIGKVFVDFILLFAATSAVIFLCNSLLLPRLTPRMIQKSDFAGTWLDMYMKLRPLRLMLILIVLPVFVEEVLFRIMITLALFENFLFFNNSLAILASAGISTLLFVAQQSIMLKNRIQILVIGISTCIIGLINSIAFLLGASFYSLFLSHYLFVIFIMVFTKQKEKSSARFA